jgi:NADH-quinone oxidoreductase subunit G
MLNRNRCILCTRCIRFMREVDGDPQINIIDRGYGSEIATFREEGVHSLVSGNLMDVCPVGAITTRDYRFKSRPWDNPNAVDTICTQCSKGCNTTAWIKAKPEWAKGARLVRFTPRFNPDVNGYWMCDIGRFEYHWIEGEHRLRRPMMRDSSGGLQPVSWHEALLELRGRAAQIEDARSPLAFLSSAHASIEELYLLKHLASRLGGWPLTLTWQHRDKAQPKNTKFRVPPTDAPNVDGARDLGIDVGPGHDGPPDLSRLKAAVETGQVRAVYVFDPGPDGSLGDMEWLIEARRANRLSLLIVHGVLMTPLASAADLILPGACAVEKDAVYTNDQGRVQAGSRVNPPPGDAAEDWLVLVRVGQTLDVPMEHGTASDVRAAIAHDLMANPSYANLAQMAFARPVTARHWLQTSNPSERWKWDFLFQDLPPVKFRPEETPGVEAPVIPLRPAFDEQPETDAE